MAGAPSAPEAVRRGPVGDTEAKAGMTTGCSEAAGKFAKKLAVNVCYGAGAKQLTLKITLPFAWEEKTCSAALVAPFCKAYEKKHGIDSVCGPISLLRVGSACMSADEPASCLRACAHGTSQVDVELVAGDEAATVQAEAPTVAMVLKGERLCAMILDKGHNCNEMHELVDAAIRDGPIALRALVLAKNANGSGALHLAATCADEALFEKLASAKVNIDAFDGRGETPLMHASRAGRPTLVSLLLELGASAVGVLSKEERLPLHVAVEYEAVGSAAVIRLLVQAGAPLESFGGEWCNKTPLMMAASAGHYHALETLLELGADPMALTRLSKASALDFAADAHSASIIFGCIERRGLATPEMRTKWTADGSRIESLRKGGRSRGRQASEDGLALEDAFWHLQLPKQWLPGFRERADFWSEVRAKWRAVVLANQPGQKVDEEQARVQRTLAFAAAMESFAAIEAHLRGLRSQPQNTDASDGQEV